ncbi:MAG: putative DNA binding domain-containing protein [Caldilineaceae bacterium]|nr:putative DNA binding domain-containing protein [Caldilineaceae bacterium]MCB9140251.1 putative DNA binding domain-containing protein [Caldilineaceae bacterium]
MHVHTPGSNDYEDPSVTYLDVLRTAVERDLDVIALTDHNTVAGIAAIRREVEWLSRLERDDRLTEEEQARLSEWRELSEKVLVLPGFEFTATFGFHILGIFPPETSVRELEHILLQLNIPADKLDIGSTETGASTDVLTAYKIIREAGGLVIAAHANSTHGVAMRNFPFGGQTKIAFTQDSNLDCLEVTDLERSGRSTARFFNGSKMEYPRRMHCIQGSDAHRLTMDPKNPRRLGVGERATEFNLLDPSFDEIAAALRSKQFDRTRPARPKDKPFDSVAAAREEGATLVQSFRESASARGGRLTTILTDVAAFANTMGGTVYVGVGTRKGAPKGLSDPKKVEKEILQGLDERVTPPLEVKTKIAETEGVKVLIVETAKGDDRPYCLDDHKFYVRDEGDTSLAVRDEIVALIRNVLEEEESGDGGSAASGSASTGRKRRRSRGRRSGSRQSGNAGSDDNADDNAGGGAVADQDDAFYLPQIGVEIVDSEKRQGNTYHSIRDLRNNNVIKNVTRKGARKLWNYAIAQHEDHPVGAKDVQWDNNVGLIRAAERAGKVRYDLALRENGGLRIFYGVTEDGMEGKWAAFIKDE